MCTEIRILRFVLREDEVYIWNDNDEAAGFKLRGVCREIWVSLEVLRRKSELLSRYDNDLYWTWSC